MYDQYVQSKNFESRPPQRKLLSGMISEIDSNDDNSVFIGEAPTGSGKSLTIIISAIQAAQSGKNVVISCPTITLMDQLIRKDFPDFFRATKQSIPIRGLKGASNYACKSSATSKNIKKMLNAYGDGWDGELSQMPIVSGNTSAVVVPSLCSQNRCEFSSSCAYYTSRQSQQGEIIVTNHAFALSCLKSKSDTLPKPEESVWIFDEAHLLPEIAIGSFGTVDFSLRGMMTKIKILNRLSEERFEFSIRDKSIKLYEHLRILKNVLSLNNSVATKNEKLSTHRLLAEQPIENVKGSTLEGIMIISNALITDVEATIFENDKLDPSYVEALVDICEALKNLVGLSECYNRKDYSIQAQWLEYVYKNRKLVDIKLNHSPLSSGGILRTALVKRALKLLFISGTMQTMGSLAFIKDALGLKGHSIVRQCIVPSLFNWEKQVESYLPVFKYSAKQQKPFTKELGERLPDLVKGFKSTLVLFCSRWQMEEVFNSQDDKVRSRILIQSTGNNQSIIEEHKSRIDKGKPSIIFGLTSFSVGVDLPGIYCEHVLITKINFAVPNSPYMRCMEIGFQKEKRSLFSEYTLVMAARSLEQTFGRLIRTKDDVGRITYCDNRVVSAKYSRKLTAGIPLVNKFGGF